jgi:hypothetical protein
LGRVRDQPSKFLRYQRKFRLQLDASLTGGVELSVSANILQALGYPGCFFCGEVPYGSFEGVRSSRQCCGISATDAFFDFFDSLRVIGQKQTCHLLEKGTAAVKSFQQRMVVDHRVPRVTLRRMPFGGCTGSKF